MISFKYDVWTLNHDGEGERENNSKDEWTRSL